MSVKAFLLITTAAEETKQVVASLNAVGDGIKAEMVLGPYNGSARCVPMTCIPCV